MIETAHLPESARNLYLFLPDTDIWHQDWWTIYFISGIPRSLQILLARISLISVCLGIADLLFNWGLNHQEWLGLAEKVRAKHSDRKSTVSPIGYCPNASPLQDAGRWRRKVLNDDSLKILHLWEQNRTLKPLPRLYFTFIQQALYKSLG